MTFESCDSDTRGANILASPQLTLSSSQELLVTMAYVPSVEYSILNLHQTSIFGIIDTRLGSLLVDTFTLNTHFREEYNTVRYTTFRICLPPGTYQLAFVASAVSPDTGSTAAIAEVRLTNARCTVGVARGIGKLFEIANCCILPYRHPVQVTTITHKNNAQKERLRIEDDSPKGKVNAGMKIR